eukprot:CAMPEP_0206631338 /NCGR_PEP_ID=MMETSP0325_2-20121206/68144_1 /ASSEMBLY_ACC=CAM_ASM_000347 /TAXON_ID=2866 /ORGANISM="Crypthecodinium cohnii, Strain Seligo" /LENGTH=56 /DNA_ID=CAMNT_0054156439 /DNA_START=38 /DNA_END=204 /DNA_ORIENTATION=-
MDADDEHIGIRPKDILRALAVVDIPVKNQNSLDFLGMDASRIVGSNSEVIDQAESV